MRVIVYGVGAVGGVLLAALTRANQPCIGIARGAQLDAIRRNGLRLRAPKDDFTVNAAVVAHPSEITFQPDDAILLTMKGQHSLEALDALRAAGVTNQPIFCFQNGVANERAALRRFANVHGATVMMPCRYAEPGEIAVMSAPRFGMFDIGCYPSGTNKDDDALAEVLEAANFAAFPTERVMASKYGKLLMNLTNAAQAALGPKADISTLRKMLRDEGEAVLKAANIDWKDVGLEDKRRAEFMSFTKVPGVAYAGGSTTQSLMRGTGSVETDHLNGEIVFLGRLFGVPVPANAAMTRIAARMAHTSSQPGGYSMDEIMAEVAGEENLHLG